MYQVQKNILILHKESIKCVYLMTSGLMTFSLIFILSGDFKTV